jgi:hypothetical protein
MDSRGVSLLRVITEEWKKIQQMSTLDSERERSTSTSTSPARAHTRTRTRYPAFAAAAHFFFFLPNSFIPPCPPDLKSDSCFCARPPAPTPSLHTPSLAARIPATHSLLAATDE